MWRLYKVAHDEAVLDIFEGEGCPIPRHNEMHDMLCTRHKQGRGRSFQASKLWFIL